MSVERTKTLEFIRQLATIGMERKDILPRAYNFAYALCQQNEEMKQWRGSGELSSGTKAQCMDIAVDILKAAVEEWNQQFREAKELEPLLPAGEWEELAPFQRRDIREMKDHMVRHLNAEVEAFYKWHPDLKIEYRFQVEAVRR